MTAAVELRSSADAHVDTKFARLEWVAPGDARAPRSIKPNEISAPSQPASPLPQQQQPPAAIPRISPELMSRLVRRGQDLLKNGDIAAARLVLRPAADAGNAQAALMLGASFDPIFLAEIKVVGLAGDRATASAWYQRAMEFGIDRNAVLGTVRQMIDPIPDKGETGNLESARSMRTRPDIRRT